MSNSPCGAPPFLLPADAGRDDVCAALQLTEAACARLDLYVQELRRWNGRINLVAPSTLGQAWVRHVADGAQLLRLWPDDVRQVIDLGSGSGVPGLVLALAVDDSQAKGSAISFTLVESQAKKCAFLRQVAQKAQIHVTILNARIESLAPQELGVDTHTLIVARALAPLPRLLALAEPLFAAGARALLHKGAGVAQEIAQAEREGWTLQLRRHASITDASGCLLEIRSARRA